jgi:hypothetical protein
MSRVINSKSLLDQYYTKKSIVDFCIRKIRKYCDLENTILIDSSCGDNYFAYKLDIPHYSYDICLPISLFQSIKTKQIISSDFLKSELPQINPEFKSIIGFNVPYGLRNQLSKQFLLKIYNYSPDYITLILLKPITNNWIIPGYTILFQKDLPRFSFEIEKNIPTEFIIWKRNKDENKIELPTFLPRAKIIKHDSSLAKVSRSKKDTVRPWCSIAVRFCGVNAGNHYYIFHHNKIYFHDYTLENKLIKIVDQPLHVLPNVFTIINFKKNLSLESLNKIVLFCFKQSSKYINKNALRYNFNTSDVARIFNDLV